MDCGMNTFKYGRTKWLSGMKLRKYRKYKKRISVDGVLYSFEDYTKLFRLHSNVNIGDYIFTPYRSIWVRVKEIKIKTSCLFDYTKKIQHKKVKHFKYIFVTELGYFVYDLNEYKDYFQNDINTPKPPTDLGNCWY